MVKNLRALRINKGVSQQQLADVVGVSQQSVNKYERQTVEPDIATLMALADYFGTTVDFLIGHAPAGRGPDPQAELELTRDELELVRDMRRLTANEKKSIRLVMENYLQKEKGQP